MNSNEISLAGGVGQLADSFANAFADISQSDFIAQQFTLNEQLAGVQAKEAINQGKVEQEVSQEKTGQLSGEQIASEAAQGVSVHGGTAEITREQTGEIGGLDYTTIGNNAFLKSLGYKIDAVNNQSSATMQPEAGTNKAANSLLAGGIDFYQSSIKANSYPSSQELDSASLPIQQWGDLSEPLKRQKL